MNLLRRRYRVLIDVDVTIHPIDPVRAADLWRKKMDTSAQFQDLHVSIAGYIAHQQRLFDVLTRDENVRDAWLRNEVLRQITEGDIEDYRDGPNPEHVLAPALTELSSPRRTFFERMRLNAALPDALSPLWDSGRARIRSLDLHDVPLARRSRDGPRDYRYRASIEVDAGLEQINRYRARFDYCQLRARSWDAPLPDFEEFIDHQIGLASAVVQHEGALDHLLREKITLELAHGGAAAACQPIPLRKFLKRVIRRLPEEDRWHFMDAAHLGVFLASIGAIRDALSSRILFMTMFAPERLTVVK